MSDRLIAKWNEADRRLDEVKRQWSKADRRLVEAERQRDEVERQWDEAERQWKEAYYALYAAGYKRVQGEWVKEDESDE